jgi:hypothetical protein
VTVRYSTIQDEVPGDGNVPEFPQDFANIDLDPEFVEPGTDYRLTLGSPSRAV